ncbi:MAG: zf-HC2 domain-containing protein [Solirubrobacterales bacterium]|jgi:hypothetical protein
MHLADAQLEGYARRTLPPMDLLAVDDHLAACDACRSRAAALAGVEGALADLRGGLLPIESHLSDAQVVEYAAGEPSGAANASLDAHLEACPTCAREVRDMRAFARRRPGRRGGAYAAAAAALIALATASLMLWRSSPAPERPAEPPTRLAGLETLPAEQRQRVLAALGAGVAEPAPGLADLSGAPEALMGASPAGSFRLIEPLATFTVSDRPTFRWEPAPGADAYTVSLFDESLRPVAGSPAIRRTDWTPDEPLPRGRTFLWQVAARRGAETVAAPAPPALPARFRVLDENTAGLLGAVARDHPESNLLLGILYAQAGARDEAAAHLARVPPTDPLYETARRTLERVRPRP